MFDHNHTHYKRWPIPETVAQELLLTDDESELLLAQLKVLFPDDKIARLIYLNEYRALLNSNMHELAIQIRLLNLVRSHHVPGGIEWMREKNG